MLNSSTSCPAVWDSPAPPGCTVEHTVLVVNEEAQPFSFSILETSRHSQGFQDSLLVQPMTGTLPPRHRWLYSTHTHTHTETF